jgi:hypothetical protein
MALVPMQVVNPKTTAVTVGANTAAANAITVLQIDNTLLDAYTFLAQGCALIQDGVGTIVQHEQAGFLLYTGTSHAP